MYNWVGIVGETLLNVILEQIDPYDESCQDGERECELCHHGLSDLGVPSMPLSMGKHKALEPCSEGCVAL